MILRYENTIEDLIAFNRDYLAHSRVYRRQVRANRVWFSLGAFLFYFYFVLLRALSPEKSIPSHAVIALIGAGVIALIYPWIVRRHEKKMLAKMIAERRSDPFVGPHELEIADSGLIERSPNGETRTAWHAVQTVRNAEGRTFLYVGPAMAHIVPHGAVTPDELSSFLQGLKRHVGVQAGGEEAVPPLP